MKNFKIVVEYKKRYWPFSWGPLCRGGRLVVECDQAAVEVFQRDKSEMTVDPVVVSCFAGEHVLSTTADFRELTRLKRRTAA